MDFKTGWSEEINGRWTKMDVTIEELDVRRFLIEMKLNPDAAQVLTPLETYRLMDALGETLVLLHQLTHFPQYYDTPEQRQQLKTQTEIKKLIFSTLAERWNGPE